MSFNRGAGSEMALPFLLVRSMITDCTIKLDADVGFCELREDMLLMAPTKRDVNIS
jgi:hypothetical protein